MSSEQKRDSEDTPSCPVHGIELKATRRRGEFDTMRTSGYCENCGDWKVIEEEHE